MKKRKVVRCDKCLRKNDFNWYCVGSIFDIGVVGIGIHIFNKYVDKKGEFFITKPEGVAKRCRLKEGDEKYLSDPDIKELLEI